MRDRDRDLLAPSALAFACGFALASLLFAGAFADLKRTHDVDLAVVQKAACSECYEQGWNEELEKTRRLLRIVLAKETKIEQRRK